MTLDKINAWEKVRDLLYYDGPLLSLFVDREGRHWIYFWVDVSDTHNTWLLYPCSLEHASEVETQAGGMRSEILSKEEVYLIDIDEQCERSNLRVLSPAEIPEEYLPATG